MPLFWIVFVAALAFFALRFLTRRRRRPATGQDVADAAVVAGDPVIPLAPFSREPGGQDRRSRVVGGPL